MLIRYRHAPFNGVPSLVQSGRKTNLANNAPCGDELLKDNLWHLKTVVHSFALGQHGRLTTTYLLEVTIHIRVVFREFVAL
jgi:hypothetical protein